MSSQFPLHINFGLWCKIFFFFIFPENEDQDNHDEQESVSSVETAALIQKLLPNSSPATEAEVIN